MVTVHGRDGVRPIGCVLLWSDCRFIICFVYILVWTDMHINRCPYPPHPAPFLPPNYSFLLPFLYALLILQHLHPYSQFPAPMFTWAQPNSFSKKFLSSCLSIFPFSSLNSSQPALVLLISNSIGLMQPVACCALLCRYSWKMFGLQAPWDLWLALRVCLYSVAMVL